MIRKNYLLTPLAGLVACAVAAGDLTARPSADAEKAAVRNVIAQFSQAVAAKDERRILSLFVSSEITWYRVQSDAAMAQVRTGTTPRERVGTDTPAGFAHFVANSKEDVQELADNIVVESDGYLASATFDYVFYVGKRITNRGLESWHLIKTDEGWKIDALSYSVRLPTE